MAVEPHHLRPLAPELLLNRYSISFASLSTLSPPSNTSSSPSSAQNRELAQFTDSAMLRNSHTAVAPPLSAAPSDSATTISGGLPFSSKKRPRDPLSFLGEHLLPCFHQQTLDLDRLLLHHTERIRLELAGSRRSFSRQLMAAMEDGIGKRLKAKEDEIERMRKLNWAMEERIRTLSVENDIWKELAQTNEATANLLRTNLEQILTNQIRIKEEQRLVDEASPADDAESCCCGGVPPPAAEAAAGLVRACRSCGVRETTVLILPCRHLCLCSSCAGIIHCCPVCSCANTGTVNVILS